MKYQANCKQQDIDVYVVEAIMHFNSKWLDFQHRGLLLIVIKCNFCVSYVSKVLFTTTKKHFHLQVIYK